MRQLPLIVGLVVGGVLMLWLAWRDKPTEKLGYERRNGMKLKARLYKDVQGQWRFRLIAGNNEPLDQSEAYRNKEDAKAAILLITSATEIEIIEEE